MDLTKNRVYRVNPYTGERYEKYGYTETQIKMMQSPYFEKEVELKDIVYRINKSLDYSYQNLSRLNDFDFSNKKSNLYAWEDLENDIKKYGLLNPICVRRCNRVNYELEDNKKSKYCCIDGNHRCKVLYKLYPHNHKITVRLYGPDKLSKFSTT
tara:strand:+ start:801 stop:1262 length:462 start_codon:yes stop_codon:yes gene_type:complete